MSGVGEELRFVKTVSRITVAIAKHDDPPMTTTPPSTIWRPGTLLAAVQRAGAEGVGADRECAVYGLRAEPGSVEEPELNVVPLCVNMAEQLASLGLLDREEVRTLRAGWGW